MDLKKLLAVAAAVALGVFFWHSQALYPLKLLTVLIHESGHALAAKAVGGTVDSLSINSLEGGVCLTRIPQTFTARVVTYSSGYLGSALAGALILLSILRWGAGRLVLGLLSAGLLVVTVLWARTLFTVLVALGFAAALGLAARYLPREPAQLLALFVGTFVSLYALFDFKDDLLSGSARRAGTDASMLADITPIPAIVWAGLWTLVGLGTLGGALWLGARGKRGPAPAVSSKAGPRLT